MSTYEQKENTGSLFKNDKKEIKTHPDYKGSALVAGVDYWISAWINESKDGMKYMKLSFQVKEERAPQAGREDESHLPPEEQSIPF